MSYHILHVMDYGCRLVRERGLLVCKKDGKILGKIALEDLRAVILLNGAVSISGDVIAALSEFDAVIVHCRDFKPVGITVPNNRTYDAKVVLNQSAGNKNLNGAIWRRLLAAKIRNNAECLRQIGIKKCRLFSMAQSQNALLNESLCAREYWKHYFPQLGEYGVGRDPKNGDSKINVLLNYGYGMMSAIIHRAIIVAGLNCLLGVNHKTYYKNTPLVHDVIEPFRAFVDFALYQFITADGGASIAAWSVFFGKFLRDRRVKKASVSMKLCDAADYLCETLANTYRRKDSGELWTPNL